MKLNANSDSVIIYLTEMERNKIDSSLPLDLFILYFFSARSASLRDNYFPVDRQR